MAGGNIQFQEYLANEVRKVQGIYVPIHAGIIRRLLVRKTSMKRLHPNPDDEFCFHIKCSSHRRRNLCSPALFIAEQKNVCLFEFKYS